MQAAKRLAIEVGVSAACEALGGPRSSYYSKHNASPPQTTRRPSPRALSPEEEEAVLNVLNSPRFMDKCCIAC